MDPRSVLDILGDEVQHVLDAVRLDPQVVAGAETIGGRLHGPVDVAAHQVEEFPAQHGDLGLVDAVGAEDRTPPAFGALVEVVKPFLKHVFGQIARPGQAAERLSRSS